MVWRKPDNGVRGWYDMVHHGVKNMYLLIMGEITLYMHWLSVKKNFGGSRMYLEYKILIPKSAMLMLIMVGRARVNRSQYQCRG